MKFTYLLLGFSLVCSSTCHPATNRQRDIIRTPSGIYQGRYDANTSTTVFYGIRYANAGRFKPAQPILTAKNDTRVNATEPGPACFNFQIPGPVAAGLEALTGTVAADLEQVEDCLSLDVYVPDGNHKDLPVLLYIPGGGFVVGYSAGYGMRPLVSRAARFGRPFIAVAVNYRLGPFGFLNPSIAKDEERNIGLSDQLEAMRFIRRSVHAFGGDPDKITIMGESAGAASVMQHVLSNNHLFRAAWLASVPSTYANYLGTTTRSNDRQIGALAEAVGCPTNQYINANVHCLEKVDATEIVNKSIAWEAASLQFGGIIKENVFHSIRRGYFQRVPLVVSTLRDEGTSLSIGFKSDDDETTSYVIDTFINSAGRFNISEANHIRAKFFKAYPNIPALGAPYDGVNTTYGEPSQYKRIAAITTDTLFTEAFTEYIRTFSRYVPTWGIFYETGIFGPGVSPALQASHGADLALYFPTVAGHDHDPRKFGRQELVDKVHDAISNFVTHLNPNGCEAVGRDSVATWPPYDRTHRLALVKEDGVGRTCLPYRPGFDLIRETVRPDGF